MISFVLKWKITTNCELSARGAMERCGWSSTEGTESRCVALICLRLDQWLSHGDALIQRLRQKTSMQVSVVAALHSWRTPLFIGHQGKPVVFLYLRDGLLYLVAAFVVWNKNIDEKVLPQVVSGHCVFTDMNLPSFSVCPEEDGTEECIQKREKSCRTRSQTSVETETSQHCVVQGFLWNWTRISVHSHGILWRSDGERDTNLCRKIPFDLLNHKIMLIQSDVSLQVAIYTESWRNKKEFLSKKDKWLSGLFRSPWLCRWS